MIGLEEDLFDVIVTSTEAEPKPSPKPFKEKGFTGVTFWGFTDVPFLD